MNRRNARTTYKLIVLMTIAAATLLMLFWVNQQHVRDVQPRPGSGQSGF